jgi:hypothetical protein
MRASPSFNSSGIRFYAPSVGGITFTLTTNRCSPTSGSVVVGITGGTVGQSCNLYVPASSSAYIELSSEL